jgi:hypothetical protein
VRGELEGLWLCGASTVSHGVHGAHVSGLAAAADLLGVKTSELLKQKGPAIRIYPSEDLSAWPEDVRRTLAVPTPA